jgi:hypothetical protein
MLLSVFFKEILVVDGGLNTVIYDREEMNRFSDVVSVASPVVTLISCVNMANNSLAEHVIVDGHACTTQT